jgi:hypothetical protein
VGLCPHQRVRSRCEDCRTQTHASVPDRREPVSGGQEDCGAAQREVRPKVEEFDGSYDCLICSESVRGKDARKCSACTCQPWHTACAPALTLCPQCTRSSVVSLKAVKSRVQGQSTVVAPEQPEQC